MRPTTGVAFLVALLCTSSPLFGLTGDGYIGVFGDAAGTILCMQALPGVPTTSYVVGKTAGETAGGITGAEFRVEVANPSGYRFNYTAPEDRGKRPSFGR